MRASSTSARSATLTDAKAQPPRDAGTVALLSAVLTLAALAFCSQHQLLLLYGDAVAHLHIARRIFDSRDTRLSPAWFGLAAAAASAADSVRAEDELVAERGRGRDSLDGLLCRVVRRALSAGALFRQACDCVVAVAFFALNPGLLYLPTTAMTEPLFLAEMIWAALLIALLARARKPESEAGDAEGLGRLLLGARWCWCAPCSRAMTDGSMRLRRGALRPGL